MFITFEVVVVIVGAVAVCVAAFILVLDAAICVAPATCVLDLVVFVCLFLVVVVVAVVVAVVVVVVVNYSSVPRRARPSFFINLQKTNVKKKIHG